MFAQLGKHHALTVVQRLVEVVTKAPLRMPMIGEPEERYVASTLMPIVRKSLVGLRGLTLHGEGLQRAVPALFLGYKMYPDLAVMNYNQRIAAIEVKYVDFAIAKGDLSTAIGQTVIYARAGYLAALGILVGVHAKETESKIDEENARLAVDGYPWRLCSPRLTQSKLALGGS